MVLYRVISTTTRYAMDPATNADDAALLKLFAEKLPKAILDDLQSAKPKLTTSKDGSKPFINKKQNKTFQKMVADGATDDAICQWIWEDVIRDDSGPHIPVKWWDTKEGETRIQVSTTHKTFQKAWDPSKTPPIKEDDIQGLPAFAREYASTHINEGITYAPFPATGTLGRPIYDFTEAPNWNGTVNLVGEVTWFLGPIKSEKIKYTATKVLGVKTLGFSGGAEAPVAISSNDLFD